MFLEDEEWNDDNGGVPSPTVTSPKENSNLNVKTKVVGKKSLLRTLQMLGSVPEWKSEERGRGSDSETESPSTEHTKKKRKKHRRKRKRGEIEEQAEDAELSQGDTQDTDPPKRKKKDKLEKKVKSETTDTTKDLETAKAGKETVEDPGKKLNRQQWKNRMKNKRKCKNKFRPKELASKETEGIETDQNDSITSQTNEVVNNNNNKEQIKSSEESIQSKVKKEAIKKKMIIKDLDLQVSATTQKSKLNIKAQIKKEKLRKILQSQETTAEGSELVDEADTEKEAVTEDTPDPSASLRSRMEQRLESARFRYINEVLYSSTSREARRMFTQDPQAFWVYHRGYSAQVQRWPNNPVDDIIQFIQKKPSSLVVADFGCGDCKIAKSVKNKVHSFDLVATCELVTPCDMANVPLKDGSVDIAVFCLSLMGTNLAEFLKEANRVLRKGGFLKIAEVSSRFDNERSFLTALAGLGFKLVSKDTENSHFYSFDFVKTGPAPENMKKLGLQLKPCLYKKR